MSVGIGLKDGLQTTIIRSLLQFILQEAVLGSLNGKMLSLQMNGLKKEMNT